MVYEKAIAESSLPDETIGKYFPFHIDSSIVWASPYPEKPQFTEKEEELKRISEMLSKLRTYDSGIKLLNSFLDQHPDFQISKYFTELNYEPKFINKVMGSLESNYSRQVQAPVL